MSLTEKQARIFLFVAQGVGAIFGAVFLTAYFGGLPSTATLNSEPSFIVSQSIIGAIFIVIVLAALILAAFTKSKR